MAAISLYPTSLSTSTDPLKAFDPAAKDTPIRPVAVLGDTVPCRDQVVDCPHAGTGGDAADGPVEVVGEDLVGGVPWIGWGPQRRGGLRIPVVLNQAANQYGGLDTVVGIRSCPPSWFRLQSTPPMPETQPSVTRIVDTLLSVMLDPRPRLHPTACYEQVTNPATGGRHTLTKSQADLMRLYDQADPQQPDLYTSLQALNDHLDKNGWLNDTGDLSLEASRLLFDGWRIVDEPAEMVYESQQRTWRWR